MADQQHPGQAPSGLTPKGERTRQHILDTALALFTSKGYEQTTLRDIAGAAGCSLGLTYRYFASKEDLVLALYGTLATELAEQVRALPPWSLAERFTATMQTKLALIEPYRPVLGALFGAAVNPASGIATLGSTTAGIRRAVGATFAEVVRGASDAPAEPQAGQLATLLYSAHLLLLLFWLHDRSPQRQATSELLTFVAQVLGLAGPLLDLEPVSESLGRLAAAIAPVFEADEAWPPI